MDQENWRNNLCSTQEGECKWKFHHTSGLISLDDSKQGLNHVQSMQDKSNKQLQEREVPSPRNALFGMVF